MVSGSISPRYSRYFSPFPHGTCSLSVSQEYLALPDGAGRLTDFTCPALLRILLPLKNLPVRDYPLRPTFPSRSSSFLLRYRSPTTPLAVTKVVWAVPLSLATTNGITNCFLFLRVLRCFSSPGLTSFG